MRSALVAVNFRFVAAGDPHPLSKFATQGSANLATVGSCGERARHGVSRQMRTLATETAGPAEESTLGPAPRKFDISQRRC